MAYSTVVYGFSASANQFFTLTFIRLYVIQYALLNKIHIHRAEQLVYRMWLWFQINHVIDQTWWECVITANQSRPSPALLSYQRSKQTTKCGAKHWAVGTTFLDDNVYIFRRLHYSQRGNLFILGLADQQTFWPFCFVHQWNVEVICFSVISFQYRCSNWQFKNKTGNHSNNEDLMIWKHKIYCQHFFSYRLALRIHV